MYHNCHHHTSSFISSSSILIQYHRQFPLNMLLLPLATLVPPNLWTCHRFSLKPTWLSSGNDMDMVDYVDRSWLNSISILIQGGCSAILTLDFHWFLCDGFSDFHPSWFLIFHPVFMVVNTLSPHTVSLLDWVMFILKWKSKKVDIWHLEEDQWT